MEFWGLIQHFCVFLLVSAQDYEHNVCEQPEIPLNAEVEAPQRFFIPGAGLVLSCKTGYTQVLGPRRIVCSASGTWSKTKLQCRPIVCPYHGDLSNGHVYYEGNTYQSTVNYTCNEGHILLGDDGAVCLANGSWSTSVPECKPVSCGLAPIPRFGMIIYDRAVKDDVTPYGTRVTYQCLPPYAVFGNTKAHCTAQGFWTETPECRVVTCPPPPPIDKGYVLDNDIKDYFFMDTVGYDCFGDYVLEGSHRITCQKNGQWSQKPSCKAPCEVGIARGRILYKEKKIWIEDLKPNMVAHMDLVSVYCMDQARKCGYAVPSQCIDGTLIIPGCFREPSIMQYHFQASLPSEIQQC
ncbi:beta-2-glycoprotein 1-like [Synchiropus splendidus]|uniref:beta-2-glycoprotein 1-like n=1 Tax=Synchiropus splendidus TaxID=270530 RepID=UPI00237D7751|nr:beta-2-glycoprotein 1-like [Synchiropus splendidus]